MKFLYGVSKVSNHCFTMYHTYHREKFGITESSYNPSFFCIFRPFDIMKIQTDNRLILADNNFTSMTKVRIKVEKIKTKD